MLFRKKEVKTEVSEQKIPPSEFKISFRQQIFELPTIKDKTKLNVRYPLIEPFAYAHIFWDVKKHELIYQIEEPVLNVDEKRVLGILEKGIEELINISFIAIKSSDVIVKYLEDNVKVLLNEYRIKVAKTTFLKLMYYVYRDFVGLNEIEPIMRDYFIEDIECNGLNSSIYIVHRKYRNIRTNLIFTDMTKLTAFVEKLAQKCGKYISYASPLLDGALPDGSIDHSEPFIYREKGIVKISRIGKFIDKFYNKDESNKPVKVNNIEVPAFDNDLKINWRKINYVYRHKIDDKLYELKLEAGRKVKLTGAHSVFVLRKDGIKSEKTSNLKIGDYVVVPINLPESNTIKELNLAKELSESKFYKKFVLEGVNKTIFKIKEKEIRNYYKINYKRPIQTYYEHRKKVILPIKLYTLLEDHELKKCRIKTTSNVTIPVYLSVSKELLRLLGYYIAEGWLLNCHNKYGISFCLNKNEKEYIEDINTCLYNCFGEKAYLEKEVNNSVKLILNSFLVWVVLKEVLKISSYAKNKEVPEIVFNVSTELQEEFVKGWHNGDYGSTASDKLARDISYLGLFNSKIVPFYKRDTRISFIKGREIKSICEFYTNFYRRKEGNFHTAIPMEIFNPLNKLHYRLSNKRIREDRLKKILDEIRFKRFSDLENVDSKKFILEWSKRGIIKKTEDGLLLTKEGQDAVVEIGFIRNLLDSDFAFLKINNIQKVESTSEFVYDVSVPECENFVAGFGGICCHNSRANATYTQDITSKGPTFTIRKFTAEPWSPIKLMQFRTVSPEVLAYLWLLIEYESNILVVGGTGSGKTSFLNSIAFFVPPQARIVSIEDTRELNLLHENWLPSVAREGVGVTSLEGTKQGEVTLFDLLKESFRQRPDYVIVGEIRGKEAYVLFQGMSSIKGDEKIMVLNDEHPKRISIKDMKKNVKYKVITYDELGNAKIMPVKFIVEHPNEKALYEIVTKKGRKITVSKNHSLFNYNNGIVPIEAEKIKEGDKVLIPSKIPCGYCDIDEIDLMDYLNDIRVYGPRYVKEASHKLSCYNASKICGVSSITDYYSNFKRSKPSSLRTEKFVNLMREAGIRYDKNDLIFKYDNKSKGFKGNLKLTSELLRLCGYYLSEGSLDDGKNNSRISFYNSNKEILEDMKYCIKKVTEQIPKERMTYGFGKSMELSINHAVLFQFLKRYFGKKENRHIPDFIFGLSKEKISELLSGLYSGDGSLSKDVGYYTISKELANDVIQLLLVYGIVARISRRKREGRKNADYEILFFSKWEKKVFLENVKVIGKKINIKKTGKPKNNKYINDLYLDTVVSINKKILNKPESVYDICVPGTQNFIGGFGGVLLHNSGHPSLGTMHAEDLATMVRRLETQPINLSPALVNSLDVVCIMANVKQEGKEARKVKKIIEIVKITDKVGEEIINEPFVWDPSTDKFYFKSHGRSYLRMDSRVFDKIIMHYGISREKLMDEFRKRTLLLMKMYKARITGFKEVHDIITLYYKTPELVLKKFGIS